MEGIDAAVTAGVDWVQIRDRELSGAGLLRFAERVAETARAAAARAGRELRLIVNRRADVALAIGADGLHLGFDALGPAAARELRGPGARVGVSCHAPDEVRAAAGASYAHLAPVFAPLSKPASRPPLGLEGLRSAAGARPVLAQGGVTAANAGPCVAAGAAGVAVTGAVLMADDPKAAAEALRAALDAAAGSPGGEPGGSR